MLNPSGGEHAEPVPDQAYAKGIRADNEANAFIAKRDAQRKQTEGKRPVEVAWAESTGRYDAARLARMRAAWARYHTEQAARHTRTLGALVDYHETQAERFGAAS